MDDGGGEAFDLFNVDRDGNLSVPKPTGKFQPKLKGKLIKSEIPEEPRASSSSSSSSSHPSSLAASRSVKVQEELPEAKVPVDLMKSEDGGDAMVVDGGVVEEGGGEMVVVAGEEEEDRVVREIDVFLNASPLDEHTQLYVMQYPLRPFWRPYDLAENCEDVRVKPNQMEVEFDLSVDGDSENYDNDVDEQFAPKVQTLSSTKVPFVTSYAVGIMKQNQLHLNPVHAVVQLRPSMEYLKSGKVQKRKNSAHIMGASVEINHVNEEDSSVESNSETWAKLKYHPAESPSSSIYRQKLAAEENGGIQFHMNPHGYLNNLCPVMSYYSRRTNGPSKSILLSMPVDERIRIMFEKGPQVHRFDALMHFAPDSSVDVVLKLLLQYADLVQGLWVSKSSLLCEGPEVIARDFILLLFSKRNIIPLEDLKPIKPEVQNRIMSPLARRRPSLNDWKLKDPTDCSFIKCYPQIVKQQENVWSSREKDIMNALRGFGKSIHKLTNVHPKPSSSNAVSITSKINHGTSRDKDLNERPGMKTMSDEAREVVPKAIAKVLRTHKVCSLSMINQRLQELALAESTVPKGDPRTSISAALEASKPLLKDIIGQVATQIHDVYVLKSVGSQALDPFRSVVVELYRGKEHKAKIKKAEIIAAAKMVLKRDISNQEYTQVMSELCISHKGGGWVLKRGDGNPD